MEGIIEPHDKFGNPWDFISCVEIDGYKIEYLNLGEICMGCPIAGGLAINNRDVNGYSFGGPFIKYGSYIYIPVYGRYEGFSRAFALHKLNIDTLQIQQISDPHMLVVLSHIENSRVYFYTKMDKQVMTSVAV